MNEADVELVVRTVLEVMAQGGEDCPCGDDQSKCESYKGGRGGGCFYLELLQAHEREIKRLDERVVELNKDVSGMRGALQSHILKDGNTPVTQPHGWHEVDWGTGGPPRSPIHWMHQVICAANDNGANQTKNK